MKVTTETKDWLLGEIVGYADEQKHKPIWEMTKEIKVKIIDWKPIIEKLNKSLSANGKKNNLKSSKVSVEIRIGNGVIFADNGETPILIDSECCGIKGECKNFLINGLVSTLQILEGVGVFDVTEGIPIYPSYYIDISYEDIKKCLTGEEKELWDFMGSRYEYNSRIQSNMRGMVSQYKGTEKKKK